jgi:hypothetical protein
MKLRCAAICCTLYRYSLPGVSFNDIPVVDSIEYEWSVENGVIEVHIFPTFLQFGSKCFHTPGLKIITLKCMIISGVKVLY